MTDEAKKIARQMILHRLGRNSKRFDEAWSRLFVNSREWKYRKLAMDNITALTLEVKVYRYFERGSVTDAEGYVVFDKLTASAAEALISEYDESETTRLLVETISSLRYDGEVRAEEPNREWLRYQFEYAYEHGQDDPRGAESPGDSALWLKLFGATMKCASRWELTESVRQLRREGDAVLLLTGERVRMRAAAGKDCEYAAFRDRMKTTGMGRDLAEVLNGLRM